MMHVFVKVQQCPTLGSTLEDKINVFPFLVQTDVGSDDELRILP